jgi:hypothetical protein
MADPRSRPNSQSLTDRVMARLQEAGHAVDKRARATRPKRQQARLDRAPQHTRDVRSLRRVFLDMGDSYRDYRRRTGEPVSPEVRGAADRFRHQQDIPNLVAVAASLDALDVLTW